MATTILGSEKRRPESPTLLAKFLLGAWVSMRFGAAYATATAAFLLPAYKNYLVMVVAAGDQGCWYGAVNTDAAESQWQRRVGVGYVAIVVVVVADLDAGV